jgi:hypothetical protein
MFYVFRMTEGKARDYLHTRWGVDSYDPFVDVADIFEFLRQNFTNPNEVREAKDAVTDHLSMKAVSCIGGCKVD